MLEIQHSNEEQNRASGAGENTPQINIRLEDDFQQESIGDDGGMGAVRTRKRSDDLPFTLKTVQVIKKYIAYIGPGILISVGFLDAGNFSTAVAAGSLHRYKLLFSMFLSNIMAAIFQILAAKLGIVTGIDLAANCKLNLSPNLNVLLYILTEISIVATDLAEIVGTAIALNILFNVPLLLGVILTIVDVLIVLKYYNPQSGDMRVVRIFEMIVSCFVFLTVICFAIELMEVDIGSYKELMQGFLPSTTVVEGDGLYLSLSIAGATIMPSSLFLGSGLVQARIRDYDVQNNYYSYTEEDEENNFENYRPSLEAVKQGYHYTIIELLVSLFTIALFVNCSILIVAGASLHDQEGGAINDADLFSIYDILCSTLNKTAGTIFALALLFSGLCGGFTTTLTSQKVSEGFLNWSISPGIRRSVTRAVAVLPCLILVFVAGRQGLSAALNASQVILSLLLPFVSAPLIYFTCNKKIMRVKKNVLRNGEKKPNTSTNIKHDNNNNNNKFQTITDFELNDFNDALIDKNNDNSASTSTDDDVMVFLDDNTVKTKNKEEGWLFNDVDYNMEGDDDEYEDLSNSLPMTIVSVLLWIVITILNGYLLVSFSTTTDLAL